MSARRKSYLVSSREKITGSKLPSNGDVLAVLLHQLGEGKRIREATEIVTDMITEYWCRARIPTMRRDHIIESSKTLLAEYRFLKKNRSRRSKTQDNKEEKFKQNLRNLFDVAHQDADKLISIPEDRAFLAAQREPGRRGCLGGVDFAFARRYRRRQMKLERRRSSSQPSTKTTEIPPSRSNTASPGRSTDEEFGTVGSPPKRAKRGTRNVMSHNLVACLDRTKVTDRAATFLLTETAIALGHDVGELQINRSTIRRHRLKYRQERAAAIKDEFHADVPLIVHWDGKLMADLVNREHVDRLPVIVTGNGVAQLLQVAKLPSGTGINVAKAVVGSLEKWGLVERVVGMSFDTTAANTGRCNGACVRIEQLLEKELLYFACRHHILELVMGSVYTAVMGASSAPVVELFKRFRNKWAHIDQSLFETGATDAEVSPLLADDIGAITAWCEQTLDERVDLRGDYRELVELCLIFVGGTPRGGAHFRTPGAMHHARWMSKVLYAMKMWMFRGQFRLTVKEERGLKAMCLFTARVYVQAWTNASLPAAAPRSDLQLLKKLDAYKDTVVAKAAVSKLASHLWYLSPEMVALALFDQEVTTETKRHIVRAIKDDPEDDAGDTPPNKATVPRGAIAECKIEDFASSSTMSFFGKMNMEHAFLDVDPEEWMAREDYKEAEEVIRSLAVTNDHAERGVALIQEYNNILTKDDEQQQFVLQVVADHRKRFPKCVKRMLTGQQGDVE